jgi:hypothetical protein
MSQTKRQSRTTKKLARKRGPVRPRMTKAEREYFRYDPVAHGEIKEMIRQINLTLDEVEAKLKGL